MAILRQDLLAVDAEISEKSVRLRKDSMERENTIREVVARRGPTVLFSFQRKSYFKLLFFEIVL